MTWWSWLLVGVLATHLFYAGLLLLWWLTMIRAERQHAANDPALARPERQERRQHVYRAPRDPHRW